MTRIYHLIRRKLSKTIYWTWQNLPFSEWSKQRFKSTVFNCLPFIFGRTQAYRRWKDFNAAANPTHGQNAVPSDAAGGSYAPLLDVEPSDPVQDQQIPLNILFALCESIDCKGGMCAQLYASRLTALGADCRFAVPNRKSPAHINKTIDSRVRTFAQIEKKGLDFANGRGPDIIHAWTPREVVRIFCEKILKRYPCNLVIHLENNESYLTEAAVGRPFAELVTLPEKELDNCIPKACFHPIKGRKFLASARGLTLVIDTLSHFNIADVPTMVIPPPVDERLFYPRPLNQALRKELDIPDSYLVLVYTGNVNAANRDEVLELYHAVHLLNEQGCPSVLIRTGVNCVPLGDNAGVSAYEKNLGKVERKRVPDILAAADVLVQPGTPGPFNDQRIPSELPEYFAMGRPVILPRTNLGIVVQHGVEGYIVERADAKGISLAVREINKDKELAKKLATGSVEFYLRQLASRLAFLKLDNYYRQIDYDALFSVSKEQRHKRQNRDIKRLLNLYLEFGSHRYRSFASRRLFDLSRIPGNYGAHHAAGWNWVRDKVEEHFVHTEGALLLDMFVERSFFWNQNLDRDELDIFQYQTDWLGFIHTTSHSNQVYRKRSQNLEGLFSDIRFIESLRWCRGVIVLSRTTLLNVKEKLLNLGFDIPVYQLFHPNIPLGQNNNNDLEASGHHTVDDKVFHIGWHLRSFTSFARLNVMKSRKVLLIPKNINKDWFLREYVNKDLKKCGLGEIEEYVENIYSAKDVEYTNIIKKGIIFNHYIEPSGSNLISECISLGGALVVNRHPTFEEYLGQDYPLFYDNIEEAEKLVLELSQNGLRKNVRQHMKTRKDMFSIDQFCRKLERIGMETYNRYYT